MDETRVQALIEERLKRYNAATSMKENPGQVPNISFYVTWKVYDYGCKLSEALLDYDLMAKLTYAFQERYNFDGFVEYSNRNQYRVSQLLGSSEYIVNDEAFSIQVEDFPTIYDGELAEFAKDPTKFMWEKIIPRKYPQFQEDIEVSYFQELVKEYQDFSAFSARMFSSMKELYGIPVLWDFRAPGIPNPCETLLSHYRGIKNFSIDMRRNKADLHAACEALSGNAARAAVAAWANVAPGHTTKSCFDGDGGLLAHTVMNPKQFDEFYWPWLKMYWDCVSSKEGWVIRTFTEGSGELIWDHLMDYRKGMVFLHLDIDDPFLVRERCPNAGIMGGMDTHVLGHGTKEECLTKAEHLVNTLGQQGGYIFSENRLVSYPNDTKRENLEAVCKYLEEYNHRNA
ncbi:MAG: hypothetical protein IJI56_05105 [Firmicutes bacterium]|nr:hypothetical protein [Bacillota bacterium]